VTDEGDGSAAADYACAVLNLLEDFAAEKRSLEEMKLAVLNVLEDLALEQRRLEASLRAKEILLREVHEALHTSNELARIELGPYLHALVEHLLESRLGASSRITVSVDVEPCHLPLDVAVPCGLLVNELATNALEHAFPGDRRGSVRITVRRPAAGRLVLVVADDGVGMAPAEQARAGGLGSTLVAALAQQLGGTVTTRHERGTAIEVELEVPT
jgi:two-component sensor histidine kinase